MSDPRYYDMSLPRNGSTPKTGEPALPKYQQLERDKQFWLNGNTQVGVTQGDANHAVVVIQSGSGEDTYYTVHHFDWHNNRWVHSAPVTTSDKKEIAKYI